MQYFVFYNDDYADNDGIGFEEFENKKDAEDFIHKRIEEKSNVIYDPKILKNYLIVKGDKLKLSIINMITKIAIQE